MEGNKRQLKSKEGELIEFPEEFGNVCVQFRDANKNEPLSVESISLATLKIIKDFYEAHSYDEKSVQVNMPLQSDKLKEEIDEKSFNVLEPYAGIQNVGKITPLIDAAYYLNLEGFKNACQAALAYEFIIGPTDDDIKNFKEKHNIIITPEEEKEFGEEFEVMFKELNEKKKKEMEEKLKEQK
ncbi:hypothetical protein PPERSA_04206 [Pseudocohnilembus persalinus]|uniref:SKP1 component dimerisation domain-containing protein n=1 Tax=Pseudocohnilembus persalinus TaxID=266149 RepID=A0A0V0QN36_PSEPJ|nr:hypothetical protein PPERSA_04206 [Pseudocohnilembus persalinus]|eukprot:KRX03654.1 hypothetical protein PPERSA_04206 [Pseudocohnilembus persalinus]